ncbi:MAG: hypothetical protein IBX72_04675 [Nitrospirae bacterium]|jgi:hypothetical protein|nr:hypothetical protein [Nitrospirota bacterium]
MKKKILFLVITLSILLGVLIGLNGVYSTEGPVLPKKAVKPTKELKPENKIGIARTEIFGKLQRPQVVFDHKKHTEALVKEGKEEWETCQECHPLSEDKTLVIFEFPKEVKKKDADSYMNAYHDECMDCHKKKTKQGEKSGPIVCGACHMKELELAEIKYPIVEFDFKVHDTHDKKLRERKIEDNCDLCHHIYNEELVYEKGEEWSCYYCHDLGAKRGPVLANEMRITTEKNLSVRGVSHTRCLNCHLYFTEKEGEEKAGPLVCMDCHTGEYMTVAELEKVPRPDSGQPEKAFINIKNARMKGVPFDHTSHEKSHKTCRGCHHETLNACKQCHTLTGDRDGNWVNIANAYHDVFSDKSCSGCHSIKKTEKDCAGCHGLLPIMDIQTKGPKKEMCNICHTGKKELLPEVKLSIAGLDTEKVKKEVTINILEKEYEPSKFPHVEIIEKLVKVSNDSDLGSYFHRKLQTLCEGCHHQSRAEAEVEKDSPPYCRNCHSISFDRQNMNRPRLVAAYHGQCIGCHEYMELEKARECKDCHKEKEVRPTDILTTYERPLLK